MQPSFTNQIIVFQDADRRGVSLRYNILLSFILKLWCIIITNVGQTSTVVVSVANSIGSCARYFNCLHWLRSTKGVLVGVLDTLFF